MRGIGDHDGPEPAYAHRQLRDDQPDDEQEDGRLDLLTVVDGELPVRPGEEEVEPGGRRERRRAPAAGVPSAATATTTTTMIKASFVAETSVRNGTSASATSKGATSPASRAAGSRSRYPDM